MNRKLRVLSLLLWCGSIYAAPPPFQPAEVRVTNDETAPVPVKITDPGPPARFQDERFMVITAGTTGNAVALFDVPEGMLAMVKFVSGRTFTAVDSWVSCDVVQMTGSAPIGGVGLHPVLVQKRQRPGGDYSHEFSQGMELHVPGGRQVGFTCTMLPAPSTDAIFRLGVTGTLVDPTKQ